MHNNNNNLFHNLKFIKNLDNNKKCNNLNNNLANNNNNLNNNLDNNTINHNNNMDNNKKKAFILFKEFLANNKDTKVCNRVKKAIVVFKVDK
jgi:hypothetical protein